MRVCSREAKVTEDNSGGEELEDYNALTEFILPWIGAPVWLPPTDWGPIFLSLLSHFCHAVSPHFLFYFSAISSYFSFFKNVVSPYFLTPRKNTSVIFIIVKNRSILFD